MDLWYQAACRGARAGYDGAKRRKGSKTHFAVDTLGHLLALHVTPADEQDRAPIPPEADEVQIKVAFGRICGTDLHIYHGTMDRRVTLPQINGHEISGIVSAVGEGVAGFAIGDAVSVRPLDTSRCLPRDIAYSHVCEHIKFMGIDLPGGFQSYWTVPAYTLHHLPKEMPLRYGALIEPLAVACHDIRMGQVQAREEVVVLGGSPIGMLVVMVAQGAGANVLVLEINPYRVEVARSLDIDAINCQERELLAYVLEKTDGLGAALVADGGGARRSGRGHNRRKR